MPENLNAEENRAMPEFTEVKYQTSNHCKDLSLNRGITRMRKRCLNSLQSATHFTLIQH